MTPEQLRRKHKKYNKYFDYMQLAYDFYTGECVLKENIEKYIHMKKIGEDRIGYQDRIQNADYRNDLARIIDSNTGAIFASESDANVVWEDENGNGLGNPQTPGTLAYRLMRDCDGEGTSMETLMKRFSRDLQLYPWAIVMADTKMDGNGVRVPTWKVINPMAVVNWLDDGSEMLIKEEADMRTSVFDDDTLAKVETYLHLTLDGYRRYRIDDENRVSVIDEGTHAFVDRLRNRTLPIKIYQSPLNRQVGLNIALQCKRLANDESELGVMLRNMVFPVMNVHAEGDSFDKIIDNLAEGGRAVEAGRDGRGVSFAGAPMDGAAIKLERINSARKDLYESSFQQFGDAASEKTATQIEQESASGFGAFINLMRSTIDDAQNFLFDMTAQIQWKEGIGVNNWFIANVTRSPRVLPVNPNQIIEEIRGKYFGPTALPLGREAQLTGMRQVAELLGVVVEDQTLDQQVQLLEVERLISSYTNAGLDVPAPIAQKLGEVVATILGINPAEFTADLNDRTEAERAGLAGRRALDEDLEDTETEEEDDAEDMTDEDDA